MASVVNSIFQEKLALYQQQKREISKERGKLQQMFKMQTDYSNRRGRVLKKIKSNPVRASRRLSPTENKYGILQGTVYRSGMTALANPNLIRSKAGA